MISFRFPQITCFRQWSSGENRWASSSTSSSSQIRIEVFQAFADRSLSKYVNEKQVSHSNQDLKETTFNDIFSDPFIPFIPCFFPASIELHFIGLWESCFIRRLEWLRATKERGFRGEYRHGHSCSSGAQRLVLVIGWLLKFILCGRKKSFKKTSPTISLPKSE